jgi:hypothetical protein
MPLPAIFSAPQLAAAVAAAIPPDADYTHAVIGSVDQNGAQILLSVKRRSGIAGVQWDVQAAARHTWSGENFVGGKVIMSW